MKSIYLLIALCVSLSFFGCSGAETDTPISLQIPFGGALTEDTRIFVETGIPTDRCTFLGQLWGCEYPMVNSMGEEVGAFIADPNTLSDFQVTEDGFESFTIENQQVQTNNGVIEGTITERMTFIATVLPDVPTHCNDTEAAEFSGDPEAHCIVHNGIGTGPITTADGVFSGYQGGHTEIRFLHDEILLGDGKTVIGYKDNDCFILNYKPL